MPRKHILILALVNIFLIISLGPGLFAQRANEVSDLMLHNTNAKYFTIHDNNTTNTQEYLIDFDTLAICQVSIIPIVFKNSTGSSYTLDTAIITGVDKDNFSIVIKPGFPTVVNPGGIFSFAIAYGFGPNSNGNKSARLEIFADRQDEPFKIVNLKCYVESFNYLISPPIVDFGTIPIFSSQTKTIDFENQSIFEITYRIEYSNDPGINLSAISGSISPWGSDYIDVTVRMEQPGNINEQLMFIIESPCPDTTRVNIYTELQNNEPIVTKNLDFGEIVLCDSSRKTIEYENALDVPVYLDSISVMGPDNNLFLVQSISDPIVIEPDSTYYQEVIFVSKGSFAGIKNATAISYISYGSIEKIYLTELTGSFLPSLSFSEQEIDFGEIDVGEFAEKKLVVFNNSSRLITVIEVQPLAISQVFKLSPIINNLELRSGDQIEFTIQFLPDKHMAYFDTLWFSITDGICIVDIPVNLTGSGLQNLDIRIPSIFTEIGRDDFFIPIKSKINISKSSLINVSIDIQVNMNATMFIPYGMTNGFVLTRNDVVGNERILVIRGDGVTLDGKSKTLTAILGQVLLSDFTYTPIEIKSFTWSENIPYTIQSGELTVRSVCFQQLGTIQSYSLSEMKLYKEHGSNDVRIEVFSGESGKFELFYIDLLGKREQVASWYQNNTPEGILKEFVIDATNLSGNVYNIWLKTPTVSISRLIMIMK